MITETRKKMALETALTLSGASLGVVGAVMIEPIVIVLGTIAAGIGAVLRYREHLNDTEEKYSAPIPRRVASR